MSAAVSGVFANFLSCSKKFEPLRLEQYLTKWIFHFFGIAPKKQKTSPIDASAHLLDEFFHRTGYISPAFISVMPTLARLLDWLLHVRNSISIGNTIIRVCDGPGLLKKFF